MSAEQYPPPPPPPPNYPPPPSYQGPPPADSGNRTLMLVLAYLGPFALLPFLVEKDDREVQWHAKHGLVLTAAWLVVWVVVGVVNRIVASFALSALWVGGLGGLGCIGMVLYMTYTLLFLGMVAFHIWCMIQAVNGKRVIVPGLSQYADRF